MDKIKNTLLILTLSFALLACNEEILHDLDELQANSVRVALAKAGIESWKEQRGSAWSVGVAGPDVTAALSLLDSKRIVRRPRHAPSSSSLVQTREERTYFVERTLSSGLEQTLERIPGMLEARVHIKYPQKSSYSQSRKAEAGSASVLLIQGKQVDTDLQAVKELVAGASGLPRESIAVVTVFENPKSNAQPSIADAAHLPVQEPQHSLSAKGRELINQYAFVVLPIVAVLLLGTLLKALIQRLRATQERLQLANSETQGA